MASNNRATQEKRRRERSKQDNHAAKVQDRLVRKEQKKTRDENLKPGEDPDLIGIYAGPQPILDEDEN